MFYVGDVDIQDMSIEELQGKVKEIFENIIKEEDREDLENVIKYWSCYLNK